MDWVLFMHVWDGSSFDVWALTAGISGQECVELLEAIAVHLKDSAYLSCELDGLNP